MKASHSWLKEYVPIDSDIDRLADGLTMAGLEVDSVSNRFENLAGVVVARIERVRPHPKADKLKICDVDVGNGTLSVVCGAPNVREEMLSPLAPVGTHLADGTILEKAIIRGVPSEGMLCSEAELGLGIDRSGIMVLDSSLSVGASLPGALDLFDRVMEIDLTPNRADCLSLLGIAREIAALKKTRVRYPEIDLPAGTGRIEDHTSITIEAPDHCPRYAARLVFDITVRPSPFWLQDRLLSVGLRPINNIVDITNFVMMETGQPLHAFDFDRLAENRIVVRTADAGETFVTLDGKEHSLTSETLMICDGEKPVAIGGVMGGLNSEIDDTTTRVLIESACFDPVSIRKTSKKLGIYTDASHRFERGVDPEGTLRAADRAAQLMVELGGGRLIAGSIDANPIKFEKKTIPLPVERTNRLLGTRLTGEEIAGLLDLIEFSAERRDDEILEVSPPSFRVDVTRPVDLMEEVARLWGYDNIPETLPRISVQSRPHPPQLALRDRVRRLMNGFGFSEAINYSFMASQACDDLRLAPDDPRRRTVRILNPLTEDQSVMRSSLVPGLLLAMGRNLSRQNRTIRLFEVGKIFISNGKDRLPDETEMVAGLLSGLRNNPQWHFRETDADFYDIKGVVEGLLEGLHIREAGFTRLEDRLCTYTRAGYTARISDGTDDIGLVGEIDPRVLQNFDLKQTAYIFEIDLPRLAALIPETTRAEAIPVFPAVSRDVTLIVDKDLESGKILDGVLGSGEKLVESVHLFDVFEGAPVPEGKKSISFRITYRSHEKTLEDEQVNRLHQKLSGDLVSAFKAALPG